MTPSDEAKETQRPTFEGALERLKEINERFEKGELTLEEAIRLYREGSELADACEKQLSEAERVVKKVIEGTEGTVSEEDFSTDGDRAG